MKKEGAGKSKIFLSFLFLFCGCAALGFKIQAPPEFNQKILLEVSDDYELHQAPRSGYDAGDLQSFHTQHTLPLTIEDAFRDLFGQVELIEEGPRIDVAAPDVPAIFEVKIIDLVNDNTSFAADSYRSEVTLAVAMKSPSGEIFWQQSFRGEGYVRVNPNFPESTGPNDAVVDALRDALGQMQKAILQSPQVRLQLKHYQEIDRSRKTTEVQN